MGSVVIVVVLPLSQLVIEQMDVVGDAICVEQLVKFPVRMRKGSRFRTSLMNWMALR